MNEWYAHSREGRPESEWETQRQHAWKTAGGARRRGEKFGLGSIAEAAAQVHDLGKFQPEFLAYMRGLTAKGPDHSSAGAVYAIDYLGRPGPLIAHAVAGHHTGLKDALLESGGRIERYRAKLPPVLARAKADNFSFPLEPVLGAFDIDREGQGFQTAFLIRMLFSCLIDADRIATETFMAGGAPADRDFTATPSDLADELMRFMNRAARDRQESGVAGTRVNRLRSQVLDAVAGQADAPQGIFTLTVPTGGGKTLTSLRFALDHAKAHKLDRVIVVIPFTSVIEQSAGVYREALAPFADQILEHHSAFEDLEAEARAEREEGRTALQLATETWDAPLVVTTAVQFFESLFAARTSRCRKLHNIARSVVVLDEAQTMPLHLLRPCVAALKELQRNYSTSVVLCTATQPALSFDPADDGKRPADRRSFFGGFVEPRELAPDVDALFRALKRVEIRHVGTLDDDGVVARMESSNQALCIVNSRGHARALYEKLNGAGAYHLSTLMLPAHRRAVLDEIKARLKAGKPCRVASTSLVEAGVDISFPLVLRAEAGLDQIIQAAGRANRNGELEDRLGEVLVFEAAGKKPLAALKDQVAAGAETMRHHPDVLMPAAVRAYFQQVYWRKGGNGPAGSDDLDRGGVLAHCKAKARTFDFPFETIATAMRFIDDVMEPIIVPVDAQARDAVEALRHAPRIGRLARELQRYTVGIPPAARLRLHSARVAEVIRQQEFGTQFVVLKNLDLYRPDVGLTWDDPSFVEAEKLIV